MGEAERPRILLLHGFLSGRAVWDRVVAQLGDGAECVAPDLPGYGANRGRGGGDYSLDRVVETLLPIVEREKPSIVVGHSMGAIVALALAARVASSVQAVGVAGLPVYAGRREGLAYLGGRGRIIESFVRRDDTAHAFCTVAHATRRLWLPWARRRLPTLPAEALLCTFDHDSGSHAGGLRNLVFGGRVPGLAAAAQMPVAALHGTADRAAPLAPLEALARQAGWPLRVVQHANHQVIVEQPGIVASWVRDLPGLAVRREVGPAGLAGRI